MNYFPLYGIEFNLAVGCKLDCRFCPQEIFLENYFSHGTHPPTMLSFKNFEKMLSRLEPGRCVSFCAHSEPFSNPECIPMILHAYEKGYILSICTTGTSVAKEELAQIKHIPFIAFYLHVPDKEMNSKFVINDSYLEVLEYIVDNFTISMLAHHGTCHPAVKEIVSKVDTPLVVNTDTLHDRSGHISHPWVKPTRWEEKIVCLMEPTRTPLHTLRSQYPIAHPDGRVTLCCNDYGMEHVLGNFLTQSWEEMIENDPLRRIEDGCDVSRYDLCRKCSGAVAARKLPAMRLKKAIFEGDTELRARDRDGILPKLQSAKKIAIVGLGHLFREQYFMFLWNEAFAAFFFVDNNPNLWGQPLPNGKSIRSVETLRNVPGTLAVTFTRNDVELASQLAAMGIPHINIFEILSLFDSSSMRSGQ